MQQDNTPIGRHLGKQARFHRGTLRTLGGLLAVIAVVVAPLMTAAQPPGRGAGPEMKMQDLSEDLTLTEDQETQVRSILEEQRSKRGVFVQQYQDQTRDARQALQQQFQRLQEETEERLATVLTAEQMESWRAWHEERHSQRRLGGRRNGPSQQ